MGFDEVMKAACNREIVTVTEFTECFPVVEVNGKLDVRLRVLSLVLSFDCSVVFQVVQDVLWVHNDTTTIGASSILAR